MDAQAQMISAVEAKLGPKAVIADAADIEPWVTDWRGRVHGRTRAILSPGSTDEVTEIVRLAAELRVPLVPQGGNTGMVAGATPPADGSALLLSLRRMNRIRSLSAANRLAVAEAARAVGSPSSARLALDRAMATGDLSPGELERARRIRKTIGTSP